MSKRKANIRPELIGSLFTDGTDYFKLIDCQTEPMATVQRIRDVEITITKPVSEWANLVLMKPVKPIAKPLAPRKPRADKGKTHKKNEPKEEALPPSGEPLGFDPPDLISTFSVKTGQDGESFTLRIGDAFLVAKSLTIGTRELIEAQGLTLKDIEEAPYSEGKRNLLNILGGGK